MGIISGGTAPVAKGEWAYVSTTTLGAAARVLSITGINLETNVAYLIKARYKAATTSIPQLCVNTDYTTTNYYTKINEVAQANVANIAAGVMAATGICTLEVEMNKVAGEIATAFGRFQKMENNDIKTNVFGWATIGTTNVTSIQLYATVADNHYPIGAYAQLFKKAN